MSQSNPVRTVDLPPSQPRELGLRDYLRVLRRRKLIVVLVTLGVVGATLAVSLLQRPVYAATAKVVLQPPETVFESGDRRPILEPARVVQTQIEIFNSTLVKDAVRARIGSAPKVSIGPVGETDVVRVRAEHPDRRRAREIANAYAEAYIEVRRQQAVDDTLAAARQVQAKIAELQGEIDALDKQVQNAPSGDQAAVRASVAPRKDPLVAQLGLFKQKFDQLQVDAALQTGGAQLVSPAALPSSPARPTPVRNGILALAAGLLLGVGLAVLVDFLDDTVRTIEELERAVPAVPVVGMIPVLRRPPADGTAIALHEPSSPSAEAYRALRTSVQYLSVERSIRMLQVTSPSADEGKSTIVANLGAAIAHAGQSVAVVSCDLRRPRIHEYLGLDNDVGFTSVLTRSATLSDAMQGVPGLPRMWLLASGPLPPNPSELLSSSGAFSLLQDLTERVDIVLIDSPPVLPVTDALVVSWRVDATMLVCSAGLTRGRDANRAVELLRQVGAPLVGTVLNQARYEPAYLGRYYVAAAATPPNGEAAGGRATRPAARRAKRTRTV